MSYKSIYIVFIILLLGSCNQRKEEKKYSLNEKIDFNKNEVIKKDTLFNKDSLANESTFRYKKKMQSEFQGDPLISNKEFIKSIDHTCKITGDYYGRTKEQRKKFKDTCVMYRLDFPYDKLKSIDSKVSVYNYKGINYKLVRNYKKESDADDYMFFNIFTEISGKNVDSLEVYSYENYIEALVQKNKYFYFLDNNFWVLSFVESEDGFKTNNWKLYSVKKDGTFDK